MAGELTNYASDAAMTGLFLTGNRYMGLCTAAPTDTSTLSTITEEDDANYARQQITFGSIYDNAGVRTIKNTADIEFPAYAANGTTVTHYFITDAASGTSGNIYFYGTLSSPKTPGTGDIIKWAADNFTIGLE